MYDIESKTKAVGRHYIATAAQQAMTRAVCQIPLAAEILWKCLLVAMD